MKPIKFGNEKALLITNNSVKNNIIDKITNFYNLTIENKRYHFLDKNRAKELKQKEHSFVLNTNGSKYFLFLTNFNGKLYALYISRKEISLNLVKSRFAKDLYEDTCIEGEIIKIEGRWFFYVSDLLLYKGNNIYNEGFEERYSKLKHLIENEYKSDYSLEPFTLILKDKFEYNQLKSVYDSYINSCPFKVNGYVFKSSKPSEYDILYIFPECRNKKKKDSGTDETTDNNKVINNDDDEKIFRLKTTEYPDVYELLERKINKYSKINYACIPNIAKSKEIKKWLDEEKDEYNVKCSFSTLYKKWIPTQLVN